MTQTGMTQTGMTQPGRDPAAPDLSTELPVKHGRRGVPGVMARFPDDESARDAITALEAKGIDGVDITLVGSRAEEAEYQHTRAVPDEKVLRHAVRLVLRGALLGTLGGLIVSGLVVGLSLLLSENVRDHGLAQVMIVVAFTFLGTIAGTFFSIERGVGFSESWYLTFQDIPEGEAWVAVFTKPDVAEEVLADRSEEVRTPG